MRQKLKTNGARSMNNGILFYSNRHKNYVTIATTDDYGNVNTQWTTMKNYNKNKSKQEKYAERKEFFNLLFIVLPFATIYRLVLEWASSLDPIFYLRTILIGFSLTEIATFLIFAIVKNKKEKNVYRFHSAEHMVLNAYRKLDRVPSLEEIRQFSRFSKFCGTNNVTVICLSFAVLSICTFIPEPLLMLRAMCFSIVVVLGLDLCGLLNFAQVFTTIPPTDKELCVAIAGMTTWLENEEKEED